MNIRRILPAQARFYSSKSSPSVPSKLLGATPGNFKGLTVNEKSIPSDPAEFDISLHSMTLIINNK